MVHKMKFFNANIFNPERGFKLGGFEVENGIFSEVYNHEEKEALGIDLNGAYIIPGLIDIHTHGNSNEDFSDGEPEGLYKIAKYQLQNGITSFLPTSMTLPFDSLKKAFCNAYDFTLHDHPECAEVIGIHMEGPFLSEGRKGAQNSKYLCSPDYDYYKKLQRACDNLIKILDVAPEIRGATDFIKKLTHDEKEHEIPIISIAHTDADYMVAKDAFSLGIKHVTHLFNGMPSVHHRAPGVIGAACERDDVTVELICDGIHVHPSVVRMAFKLFPHRICLISDSLRCCGMPDGEYELSGQRVVLKSGEARLKDGTLAGSARNLFDCMKKAIEFGIPIVNAVESVTMTPAKLLGLENKIGSIKVGNDADFIVCNDSLEINDVFKKGISIKGHF